MRTLLRTFLLLVLAFGAGSAQSQGTATLSASQDVYLLGEPVVVVVRWSATDTAPRESPRTYSLSLVRDGEPVLTLPGPHITPLSPPTLTTGERWEQTAVLSTTYDVWQVGTYAVALVDDQQAAPSALATASFVVRDPDDPDLAAAALQLSVARARRARSPSAGPRNRSEPLEALAPALGVYRSVAAAHEGTLRSGRWPSSGRRTRGVQPGGGNDAVCSQRRRIPRRCWRPSGYHLAGHVLRGFRSPQECRA